MLKGISLLFVFALTCGVVCAQNSNSSTTSAQRPRTNTNRTKPADTETDAKENHGTKNARLGRRTRGLQQTARRHQTRQRGRGHERLLEQPAAQYVQLQRLGYESMGTGSQESRELVSRDQKREARRA